MLKRSFSLQFINVQTGALGASAITFGARVDSLYEYFLKQVHFFSRRQFLTTLYCIVLLYAGSYISGSEAQGVGTLQKFDGSNDR